MIVLSKFVSFLQRVAFVNLCKEDILVYDNVLTINKTFSKNFLHDVSQSWLG